MGQGFYGFPRIIDIVRATTFKVIGKAGATNGAALAGGTASGAPVAPAGPFDVGDVIVDATGKLWICTTAGTDQSSPGSFTQVGGATSPLNTKGDVWVYGSADSRLAVGTNNQVLTADSTQSLGVKWAATGAATLTSATAALGADVTIVNANTYYDGPSISLAAGTWLIGGCVTIDAPSAAMSIASAKLWDGTTTSSSGQEIAGSSGYVTIPLALAIVSPGSTTTYKISAAFQVGSSNAKIKAALDANAAGNTASVITAIKIA